MSGWIFNQQKDVNKCVAEETENITDGDIRYSSPDFSRQTDPCVPIRHE